MIFGKASFICFCLGAAVCNSFVKNIFRETLTSNTRSSKLMRIADQRSTSGLAPETGRTQDIAKNSRKAESFFTDYDADQHKSYVNVTLIPKSSFKSWSASIPNDTHQFLESIGQSMKKYPGTKTASLPITENLALVSMLAFYDDSATSSDFSHTVFDGLWSSLNNKSYIFKGENDTALVKNVATKLCTSWAMSTYSFQYFKSKPSSAGNSGATIVWPDECDRRDVLSVSRAYTLMKDLVDSPALSMGPAELEAAAVAIAIESKAISIKSTVGVELLLEKNYPQIAAVGMAAGQGREPRIVDITWDSPQTTDAEPIEVVIIGKGITFDTGGLNIKGGGGMRNMKRDMAGSAQALALALWIVETKLAVRLRLLLPIAENSISGIALRPGDVIRARNGKTTEITNTDAEGRLVLADALVAAVEAPNSPRLVVDFATLTGAARVALGADLPAVFSNDITALMRLWTISNEHSDPIWMMPLYEPMRKNIKSQVADLVNAADGGGGAITAALYLSEFITPVSTKDASDSSEDKDNEDKTDSSSSSSKAEVDITKSNDDKSTSSAPSMTWFHVDFMGSKGSSAEPQGMRAIYEYIRIEILGKEKN